MIPVVTLAAYSNTGKTTYLSSLVPCLKAAGLRVAVVKHDGHDFEIDREGKDTWQFAQAGADVVAIASATKFALMEYRPIGVEDLVGRISGVDLIITEGYKHGPYPKIALYRAASGKELAVPPEQCFAIVSDTPVEAPCPVFALEDPQSLADYLVRAVQTGAGMLERNSSDAHIR